MARAKKPEVTGTGKPEPKSAVTSTGHVLTLDFPEPRCPFCGVPLEKFRNVCDECRKGAKS